LADYLELALGGPEEVKKRYGQLPKSPIEQIIGYLFAPEPLDLTLDKIVQRSVALSAMFGVLSNIPFVGQMFSFGTGMALRDILSVPIDYTIRAPMKQWYEARYRFTEMPEYHAMRARGYDAITTDDLAYILVDLGFADKHIGYMADYAKTIGIERYEPRLYGLIDKLETALLDEYRDNLKQIASEAKAALKEAESLEEAYEKLAESRQKKRVDELIKLVEAQVKRYGG
jgi:hypothetical protein